MKVNLIPPRFKVLRDKDECIKCMICIRECSYGVHQYDSDNKKLIIDSSKCVDCQRCVSLCPKGALAITLSENIFRPNNEWKCDSIKEIYRQSATSGVLLSSMGSPVKEVPRYFDRILLNASQVTNPSIDPLREPMETKVFIGRRPERIERDERGKIVDNLPPHLELNVPILFSAMSYGAISLNVHKALAIAATEIGTFWNTGEGGLHEDLYKYGENTIVQVASGRFGVDTAMSPSIFADISNTADIFWALNSAGLTSAPTRRGGMDRVRDPIFISCDFFSADTSIAKPSLARFATASPSASTLQKSLGIFSALESWES